MLPLVMVTVLWCFGSRVNLGVRSMVILGVVSCSSSALYGLCILSLLLLSLQCFVVVVVAVSVLVCCFGLLMCCLLLARVLVRRMREPIQGCSFLAYFRGRKCLSGGEL